MAPDRPQLALAQQIAADVLASHQRPIDVNGYTYVECPCCAPPAHALSWSVVEVGVARTLWAALAAFGAIPTGWLDTPTRRFACPVCFRRWRHQRRHRRRPPLGHRRYVARASHAADAPDDCPACSGRALVAPPTCADCVAFASAPDGILAAEDRVREAAAALAPWGASPPELFVWRVRAVPHPVVPMALRRAIAVATVAARGPDTTAMSFVGAAGHRAAWRAAVARDPSFAALPDPFVPLDALAATGYTLEDLSGTDAMMVAPPVELAGASFGEHVLLHDFRGPSRPGARPRR